MHLALAYGSGPSSGIERATTADALLTAKLLRTMREQGWPSLADYPGGLYGLD